MLGGDFSEDRWILDHLPYRKPVGHLYISTFAWPLAVSWMAAGYNAAQVVAGDLGYETNPGGRLARP